MNPATPNTRPIFIDTNIWLYAFNKSQDPTKYEHAKTLILQTPQIIVSTQVINEVAVNMIKKFRTNETDIQKLICSFYKKYLVIHFNQFILLKASEIRNDYRVSFWDSLILASALISGADRLYTEDMQDGLRISDQLTIVNPIK